MGWDQDPLACPRYSMLAADPDMLEYTSVLSTVSLYHTCHSGLSDITFLHVLAVSPTCKMHLEAPLSSPEALVNMHASLRQGTGQVLRLLLSYSFPLTSHISHILAYWLIADSREMRMLILILSSCTDRFRKDFTPPMIRASRYALCR